MATSTPPNQVQKDALGQVVLFQAADGQVSLDVRLEADTVWLSQAQMAELFGRERSVITRPVGNMFSAHGRRRQPRRNPSPARLVANWLKSLPCARSARLRPKPISPPCSMP